ncbi:hypothetical protein LRR81_17975 [Metabacillus sp. GX 13764]|uniref:hypothetical protein n=1 Tax=Metabacillus kandeliae TaxID=2900151 RepID=UPI001E43C0B6|nr:hypothetical protein [Metabacillus kandeliae]MCD7036134.1 hypothetical protein [Metabacillus kandeliae]
MDSNTASSLMDQLKNNEIKECYITKEDFLPFREVLVKRPDFKHFRGIGQRGGAVLYQYMETPRS